ncbi:5'-methylthioadenosine/adenosylhomocysteine nucleosidase [Basilea psittacipulmonis]|uniref:5'-methylthioadenosine/S-adenosylhomocysteine nucleosidase n=1 Tax=Basilea psittacipulmonis DSM 24701 TaxID=1072685 RepID=A0A077DAQ8_9BURK|nr:5'-methylthioadenosine/adenosylhomocysteine nucleosidase [Basilea psittacipulmonis]AIL31985.1 5'-methylthioadenosine nucleosidase [Basilea psittacipulmonis DSM 24701]
MNEKPSKIAIIGAMQKEIEILKQALSNRQTHQFGAIQIDTGRYANKDIILCLSGIGKVNASIATSLAIECFKPDCVINTGSAGGIGSGLKVGDVVIGATVAHHDVDVTAFGYDYGQVPALPTRYHSSEQLLMTAQTAAQHFDNAQVKTGLIVSGDSFIHSKEQIHTIHHHFNDAQAVEMEAASIAQTCHVLNTPFVIIRAISDSADEKADISFEEFLTIASKHSSQMVQAMIREI